MGILLILFFSFFHVRDSSGFPCPKQFLHRQVCTIPFQTTVSFLSEVWGLRIYWVKCCVLWNLSISATAYKTEERRLVVCYFVTFAFFCVYCIIISQNYWDPFWKRDLVTYEVANMVGSKRTGNWLTEKIKGGWGNLQEGHVLATEEGTINADVNTIASSWH